MSDRRARRWKRAAVELVLIALVVMALSALSGSDPLSAFWTFSRVEASTAAGARGNSGGGSADEELARLREELNRDIANLRRAVEDLAKTFPKRYRSPERFLATLRRLEKRAADGEGGAELRDVRGRLDRLTRRALVANPMVSEHPILYVARAQYASDHHNTATMFVPGEINAGKYDPPGKIKTLDFSGGIEQKQVRTLYDPGAQGLARDPEVHWSGEKIVFALRRGSQDNYHIHEIAADGNGLTRLTAAPEACDIDPVYLPDDSIIFSSTREIKYCGCNRHIMGNLYRMEKDGANIRQLSENILHDGHPVVLPDGRILYDRWEYTDRNFGDAQGLWTIRPDGTNCSVYWGNNTPSPGGVVDARPIPGTERVVCVFSSCHDRPWGAMVVLDRRGGIDAGPDRRGSVVRIWPSEARKRVGRGNWDAFKPVNPKYEDPYPLSDPSVTGEEGKYFLVSRMLPGSSKMGIYLVDVFGHEILLHAEEELSCFDPMPVRPRPRPHLLPTVADYSEDTGQLYVENVYEGTHVEGIEPGSVKYLRVVEIGDKRTWTPSAWPGQGVEPPGMNYHNFDNKRILGTVPVEDDGSAHFEVPAGRFVYFQILDEDRMMLQSMRSATWVQPGEMTGCVGCHEDRLSAPAAGRNIPEAVKRGASELNGWRGEKRFFNYLRDVQPVLDRHCAACHDYGEPAGEVLNLAGDKTLVFNTSYLELHRGGGFRPGQGGYISVIGAGPAQIQPAMSWGSHASRLMDVLRGEDGEEAHEELSPSDDDVNRIVTWLDLNAPYYPTFYTAYPENPFGRSPMTGEEMKRLGELTGINLEKRPWQVSLDRPEISACLDGAEEGSDRYETALSIIRRAAGRLKTRPSADLPGFKPCAIDRRRRKLFRRFDRLNSRSLKALVTGGKVFDYGLRDRDE